MKTNMVLWPRYALGALLVILMALTAGPASQSPAGRAGSITGYILAVGTLAALIMLVYWFARGRKVVNGKAGLANAFLWACVLWPILTHLGAHQTGK